MQDVVEGVADFAGWIEHVPVQRQQPVRPQHLCRLVGTLHGVEPVPGLPGDDGVERTAVGIPGLEIADLDLDAGLPGDLGHPRVRVDAEHRAAGGPVLPCTDASAAADVQDLDAGTGGDDALYQGVGVAGPRPVVSFGVDSERLRYLPKPVRLSLGER